MVISSHYLSSIARDLSVSKRSKIIRRALRDLENFRPTVEDIVKHRLVDVLFPLRSDESYGELARILYKHYESQVKEQKAEDDSKRKTEKEVSEAVSPALTEEDSPSVSSTDEPLEITDSPQPRLIPYGKWASLDERIDEFLGENPHFARLLGISEERVSELIEMHKTPSWKSVRLPSPPTPPSTKTRFTFSSKL
ncbi:hypothetical protein QR680_016692 [Steinernema hermaphroditum]|uniref:Uncharacterized protein n=1 Tax=Steinernema hermaphroditum TaxID=289476 RepID=A0AA39HE61_9BILA|nr:hypothetical protein QR680_016692 [Steinernema hermaphroditum]